MFCKIEIKSVKHIGSTRVWIHVKYKFEKIHLKRHKTCCGGLDRCSFHGHGPGPSNDGDRYSSIFLWKFANKCQLTNNNEDEQKIDLH